jgi:aspartate/methionine/tyrosine aminotransferase
MVLGELRSLDDYATIAPALGAFYFLVKLHQKADPMDVIEYLVSQHKVAAIPGTAFGLSDDCYLRIAYAALPIEPLKEGIGRFVTGIRAFSKR